MAAAECPSRYAAGLSASPLQFRDLSLEARSELVLLELEIVMGLEIDPEPLGCAEIAREPKRRVR